MKPYVLMIQTDPDDQLITEETLAELSITARVEFLSDFALWDPFIKSNGDPLLLLINEGAGNSATTIVKKIKANSLYSHLPCIVLTERTLQNDIFKYYQAGVSTVITKPSSIEITNEKIKTFFYYWFKVAELPGHLVDAEA
jgi:DNA-binding NarL/FixJ family response regulator